MGRSVALNIDRPRYENPVKRLEVKNLTCLDAEGVKSYDAVVTLTGMDEENLVLSMFAQVAADAV